MKDYNIVKEALALGICIICVIGIYVLWNTFFV